MKKIFIFFISYVAFLVFDFFGSIDSSFEMMDRMSESIRVYTQKHISKGVSDSDFPLNVPSYNATEIMRIFNSESMNYREVSLNPTNLNNLANPKQKEIIGKILEHEYSYLFGFDILQMKFEKFMPINISSTSCLECHSDPVRSPVLQQEIYGVDNGFGYGEGDLYGVKYMSVDAMNFVIKHLFILFFVFFSFFKIKVLYSRYVFPLLFLDKATGSMNKNKYLKFKNDNGNSDGYIFLLDVDDFKAVNDIFGHDFGDAVLQSISNRVMSLVRKSDPLFRVGGEEFLLFVSNYSNDNAVKLADSICKVVSSKPIEHQGKSRTVTVSIGYSKKYKNEDFDNAFKRADVALYRVKKSGKNHALEQALDDQI